MSDQIIISILTGGKSSRMEFQNKSFLKIHNKTFIELLLDQLKILGYEIVINVNDDEEKYSKFGFQLVADKIKGRKGPLAGLHSVMSLYEKTKKNIWFAMLPTDAPLINLNSPDSIFRRFPLSLPIIVNFFFLAISTAHAVNPDRDKSIGIFILMHLITISLVNLPVV